MYIYQVKEDGLSCAVKVRRDGKIPKGWQKLPDGVHPERRLFMVGGKLTHEVPQTVAEKESQLAMIEEEKAKIIEEQAIQKLKDEGRLPADFSKTKGLKMLK